MAAFDGSAAFVRNLTSLVISDGAGTPNTLSVPLVQGTISWSEPGPSESEVRHQGKHLSTPLVNDTDDGDMEITLDIVVPSYKGSSNTHIYEMLTRTGTAAAFTRVGAGNAWTYSMAATFSDGTNTQVLTFSPCRTMGVPSSWSAGTNGEHMAISATIKCYANRPTVS